MANVAELIVKALEQAGVTTAYGVPGEENTELMLALEASSLKVVLTRHEQAAAFMACVQARITGRPALCFATLGPGATNLVTGVADATLDYAPMIVLTGQGARARIGKAESHQVLNLQKLFEPVTKLSRTLMHPEEVSSTLAEALRVATEPRPGAVHLSLPEDLAAEETDQQPVKAPQQARATVMPQALAAAVELLKDAKHPLLVAGAGVLRGKAAPAMRAFAEAARLPMATTFMAKGILPADHPLHLHCVGQPFNDHIDDLIPTRDLIVAVGFDPVELAPAAITDGGRIPVLHLSDVPAALEHDWNVTCDAPGDIARTLRGLTAGLRGQRWPEDAAVAALCARIAQQRRSAHPGTDGIHPADALRAVEAVLSNDTLVLSGVGTHKMEVARYLAARKPGQIIIPNGLAGMGLALPGAIAAADLGHHSRVFAICGDGEFLMNLQEMETAHRLGLSLTVVVWEDGGYGLIRAKQEADTGQHTDLAFETPDWDHLAKSFGWSHHRVSDPEALQAVLEDHTIGLHLVTLPINYAQALERDDAFRDKAA
ncbi:acetolactate synthase large subunit [Roseobacter weihaiensis]|uniref:acetolactate synthase large subunit n=1 Tax=Roseobacter weihaiensis TaxID=2763262 RepID=UPI001D0B114F|nr:acetolactate synthase large subunit [Roseobacter sp. H9]